MIKIFRNIRQKLIVEGKTTNYLKYAIGEIVLVVIGILIALSINSWNQNRMERVEETTILESMRTDFLQTKKRANATIILEERVIDYSIKMMHLMVNKNQKVYNDTIAEYLFRGALSYWRVEPVNGTYDALVGSGKTEIIQNQDLNRILAEYSAELKYGFEDENYCVELNTLLTEKCSSYSAFLLDDKRLLQTTGSKTTYSESERNEALKRHLNNDAFLGILYLKIRMEENRLEYQKNLLKYVEDILNLIESELDIKPN